MVPWPTGPLGYFYADFLRPLPRATAPNLMQLCKIRLIRPLRIDKGYVIRHKRIPLMIIKLVLL